MTRFLVSDNEFGRYAHSAAAVSQPGFARFNHGGKPNFSYRRRYIAYVPDNGLPRYTQSQAFGHRRGPFLIDGNRQRRFIGQGEADACPLLEVCAMLTKQRDRTVVRRNNRLRAAGFEPPLQARQVVLRRLLGWEYDLLLTPARGEGRYIPVGRGGNP